jgi:Rad3-related DNA helicase
LTIGVNLSRSEKFSRFLGGSKQLKPPYKQGGRAQNAKIVFTLSALVVMATGTGKTRTIMALIELFLKANQARTVLFVADRDTLVRQALDDNFKVYLPNEPRDRIRTYNIDYSKRLYVGTLQTLIKCYKKFTLASLTGRGRAGLCGGIPPAG